ncbi:hypothetical protein QI466_10095, partial [Staphylococcus aureus]|nr:hypothetical protein [Staphylococcus aureus]MDI1793844.1 hypothetical protein [Staphylococcus aureus]MDI1801248.1 hypothetical protein [Staphylococcus aureus]
ILNKKKVIRSIGFDEKLQNLFLR